jgi:hypothetical protein
MKFLAIPVFALLATGVFAMPNNFEAREPEANELEARANCGQILPACNGGHVVGQTNCRCKGQKETCDLWTCPGEAPNVVSLFFFIFLFLPLFTLLLTTHTLCPLSFSWEKITNTC